MALTRAVIPVCPRRLSGRIGFQRRFASHGNRVHEDPSDETQVHAESMSARSKWKTGLTNRRRIFYTVLAQYPPPFTFCSCVLQVGPQIR